MTCCLSEVPGSNLFFINTFFTGFLENCSVDAEYLPYLACCVVSLHRIPKDDLFRFEGIGEEP